MAGQSLGRERATKNSDFPGGTSIYQGIEKAVLAAGGTVSLSVDGSYSKKPDVAVVVFGEEPYAEGHGDIDNLEYQRGNKKDLALLNKLKAQGIKVVSLFISGRPLWVNAELNASDAFVAVWLPGSEGNGVADVILRKADGEINHDFKGRLSFTWPKNSTQAVVNRGDKNTGLFGYGYGLTYREVVNIPNNLDESKAATNQSVERVVFERSPQAPWRSALISKTDRQLIESSLQTNSAITVKAIDRQVQEDARLLSFIGDNHARYQLESNFPEDLRASLESDSVLLFDIAPFEKVKNQLKVEMICEKDCNAGVDITPLLNEVGIKQWRSIAIDLQCFKAQGASFERIVSPFAISASSPNVVAISKVTLSPKAVLNDTIKHVICQ